MRHLLAAVFALAAATAGAQIYSNEFLSIGAGARAQAMGNSAVASTTGIYATYWNPAGLVDVDPETGLLGGFIHAEQFAGVVGYDFLAVSLPLGERGRRLGLSFVRQGTDDIPNTINLYNADGTLDYGNISSFSVADYAVLLSYAQPTQLLGGRLALGGNVKVIRRVIGEFSSAWGLGLDLAARYDGGPLRFGATLRDATGTFNAWRTDLDDRTREVLLATGNTLPDRSGSETTRPSLLPAVSYRFSLLGDRIGIAPELAAWLTFDGRRNALVSGDPVSADLNVGLEADYRGLVFLRLGADQWQRYTPLGNSAERLSARPAVGLGLRLKRAALDYAFSNPGDDNALYAHVISVEIGLRRPQAAE